METEYTLLLAPFLSWDGTEIYIGQNQLLVLISHKHLKLCILKITFFMPDMLCPLCNQCFNNTCANATAHFNHLMLTHHKFTFLAYLVRFVSWLKHEKFKYQSTVQLNKQQTWMAHSKIELPY